MKQNENEFQLYFEEFEKSFKRDDLKNVAIMSALIEGQIAILSSSFMEIRKFKFKPREGNEFGFNLNVLKQNKILKLDVVKEIKEFRKERKFILHDLFKESYSRDKLNKSIKNANQKGKNIIKYLNSNMTMLALALKKHEDRLD